MFGGTIWAMVEIGDERNDTDGDDENECDVDDESGDRYSWRLTASKVHKSRQLKIIMISKKDNKKTYQKCLDVSREGYYY